MTDYLYSDTTGRILNCFFQVLNRLRNRRGYSEESFTAALAIELCEAGFKVQKQVTLRRAYKGRKIGVEYADLIVNDLIVIEVKKASRITHNHIAQTLTYLQDSGLAVGLILNFGGQGPQIKRVFEASNAPAEYLEA